MKRRIGAHVSIAKGLIEAVHSMEHMGGNCIQIFSGSPRVWARKPIASFSFDSYKEYVEKQDFGPTIIHALYLVNLASENPDLLKKSIDTLKYDMQFNAGISGGGVVVHLGSHQGRGFENVFPQLVKSIEEIIKGSPKNSVFLIENSAGQSGKLCSNLSEIRKLFDALSVYVSSNQLGWCLDTCHAYAAGYDLDSIEEEIETYHLWETLKVVHLNDSRDPFESGRDRHDNIGKGNIGKERLQRFLNNSKFLKIPLILEVPGFDGNGPDKENIDIVKSLIS